MLARIYQQLEDFFCVAIFFGIVIGTAFFFIRCSITKMPSHEQSIEIMRECVNVCGTVARTDGGKCYCESYYDKKEQQK